MDAESTLEAIAQIAVSLTGFAGIAGALAGEKLRPTNALIWLSFWAMISSSVGVLFAALFPFLLHHLGASDRVTWVASSVVVAALTVCNLAFFLPRIFRAKRDGSLVAIRAFNIPLDICPAVVVGSQVLNALGVVLGQNAGGFLVGLYVLVLIAVLNFVQLLYVLDYAGESARRVRSERPLHCHVVGKLVRLSGVLHAATPRTEHMVVVGQIVDGADVEP